MWKLMITSGVLAAALAGGCAKDKDKTAGTPPPAAATATTPAKSGLDVALSDTGQADVYVTDDKGNRIPANGATGRVELPDGSNVPLTPSDGGERLTAPLGAHMNDSGHGCGATVHVVPPGGAERVARLDMCRGRGPGRMGPGMGEHGEHGGGGEMGGGMQHPMGPPGGS